MHPQIMYPSAQLGYYFLKVSTNGLLKGLGSCFFGLRAPLPLSGRFDVSFEGLFGSSSFSFIEREIRFLSRSTSMTVTVTRWRTLTT